MPPPGQSFYLLSDMSEYWLDVLVQHFAHPYFMFIVLVFEKVFSYLFVITASSKVRAQCNGGEQVTVIDVDPLNYRSMNL